MPAPASLAAGVPSPCCCRAPRRLTTAAAASSSASASRPLLLQIIPVLPSKPELFPPTPPAALVFPSTTSTATTSTTTTTPNSNSNNNSNNNNFYNNNNYSNSNNNNSNNSNSSSSQNPNTFPIQNPPPPNTSNLHIPPPQNLNQNQQFSNSKQTHPIEKVDRQNISPPQNPKLPNSKQAYSIDKVDRAVAKARRNIIAAGENVTAWQVTQDVLLNLKLDSWSSLNFPMQKVPSLHSLMLLEGKINAFIHCFVGVQRITSSYDLEVAICKNEGVDSFEKLELGSDLYKGLILDMVSALDLSFNKLTDASHFTQLFATYVGDPPLFPICSHMLYFLF
ncbi:hypothetical protein CMV_025716 [Castanea mollissima]|uniref:Uncharacterized protein n=1 Tax=Castanea mollissima TaxID=60419 RepID=A0A8J4V8C5_9ROSI|nr:hypothetical protein CMV_025716 [Castanea mollissima]